MPLNNRPLFLQVQGIPAHMRDLHSFRFRDPQYLPLKDAQPFRSRRFLAAFEQKL